MRTISLRVRGDRRKLVPAVAGADKTELGPATFLDIEDFLRSIDAGIEALLGRTGCTEGTSSVVSA